MTVQPEQGIWSNYAGMNENFRRIRFMENNTLVAFRRDIKILDATIRDGGIVNNFHFSDDFVKKLYTTCVRAGIDYMEFGYKADRDMFKESEFGKWKFSKDEDIRNIVGDNNTNCDVYLPITACD